MTDIIDPEGRLERLLSGARQSFRDSFLETVRFIRNERTLAELEDLLSAGRFDEALASAAAAAERLSATWAGVFVDSGKDTGRFVSRSFGVLADFDQVNERAVRVLRQNQFRLINGFTRTQREATRNALAEGTARGINPRAQARLFRDTVGLTPKQVQSVNNFRRLLESGSRQSLNRALRDRRFDPTIRAALRGDKVLTSAQIDRMVGRYRERFVQFRAETIARTEALSAVHAGSKEMYDQAFDNGTVNPADVVRTWLTAGSGVRDSHVDMEGQERGAQEAFLSGQGNLLQFPGDPSAPVEDIAQCRCVVTTRIRTA